METISNNTVNHIKSAFAKNYKEFNELKNLEQKYQDEYNKMMEKVGQKLADIKTKIEAKKTYIDTIEKGILEITSKYSPNGEKYYSKDLFEHIEVPTVDKDGNPKYKLDGTPATHKVIKQKYVTFFPVCEDVDVNEVSPMNASEGMPDEMIADMIDSNDSDDEIIL